MRSLMIMTSSFLCALQNPRAQRNHLFYPIQIMKGQKHMRKSLTKSFMAKPKRTPLAFNTNQLTDELKESSGKGVDAFFSFPALQLLQPQTEPLSLSESEALKN